MLKTEQGTRSNSEIEAYQAELLKRFELCASIGYSVPEGAPGSVRWIGKIGKFWWKAREEQGLSSTEAAQGLGIGVGELVCLEVGMGYLELGLVNKSGELHFDVLGTLAKSEFPRRYAEVLKKPELCEAFREEFHLL